MEKSLILNVIWSVCVCVSPLVDISYATGYSQCIKMYVEWKKRHMAAEWIPIDIYSRAFESVCRVDSLRLHFDSKFPGGRPTHSDSTQIHFKDCTSRHFLPFRDFEFIWRWFLSLFFFVFFFPLCAHSSVFSGWSLSFVLNVISTASAASARPCLRLDLLGSTLLTKRD